MERYYYQELREEEHRLLSLIATDPEIIFGKPRIRGTRWALVFLLEVTDQGMTYEEILDDFPEIEEDWLRAAKLYSRLCVGDRDAPALHHYQALTSQT